MSSAGHPPSFRRRSRSAGARSAGHSPAPRVLERLTVHGGNPGEHVPASCAIKARASAGIMEQVTFEALLEVIWICV